MTADLDERSEDELQAIIDDLARGRNLTLVVVAKNIKTIESASSLVLIENSKRVKQAQKGSKEFDAFLQVFKDDNEKKKAIIGDDSSELTNRSHEEERQGMPQNLEVPPSDPNDESALGIRNISTLEGESKQLDLKQLIDDDMKATVPNSERTLIDQIKVEKAPVE